MKNILTLAKNLSAKLLNQIKPKALLVILMALIMVIIAFSSIAKAQNQPYKSNLSFNQNKLNFLTINDKNVEIKPGLAKADMEKLNTERDPEAIKAYIQELGNQYGIDWKLVYAIGVYESGNFKSHLAQSNNNFFGRKATSTTWMNWDTAQQGIDNQFVYLKTRYFDKGMDTPAEMNRVYCEGDTWQYKVQFIMNGV